MVDELCERRAPVHARDRYGQTPLLLACTHGHHAAIVRLLEFKSSVHVASTSGYTPLHRVAMSASPHAALSAELLLRHKAKLDAVTAPPGSFTPLRLAVRAGRLDVVQLLCGRGAVVTEAEVETGGGVVGGEMVAELISWMPAASSGKGVSEEERSRGEQRRAERERRTREGTESGERARREEAERAAEEARRRRELGEEVKEGLDGRWQKEEELNTARRLQAEAQEAELRQDGRRRRTGREEGGGGGRRGGGGGGRRGGEEGLQGAHVRAVEAEAGAESDGECTRGQERLGLSEDEVGAKAEDAT